MRSCTSFSRHDFVLISYVAELTNMNIPDYEEVCQVHSCLGGYQHDNARVLLARERSSIRILKLVVLPTIALGN